jgi:hypothetical protein
MLLALARSSVVDEWDVEAYWEVPWEHRMVHKVECCTSGSRELLPPPLMRCTAEEHCCTWDNVTMPTLSATFRVPPSVPPIVKE